MDDRSPVTFLFTDIEGSTRLWEQQPDRMRPALARHDAIARDAVAAHGGMLVKMTGDGLHAAFQDPLDAIRAAVELQTRLLDGAAPGEMPLPVRCGLHAGACERRDNDFYGSEVNRAARIMSAAHGGQMILSEAVRSRVHDRLPEHVALRELGVVRLRDLAQPERVYQLLHPALRAEFPALHSLEGCPNNLPSLLTSFIGRQRELTEAAQLLATNRLVTVVGMGGLGKSRLTLHVAAEVLEDFPNGVWLVELAPLADPRRIAQSVASVLGVKEEPGRPVEEALVRFLKARRVLLLLDNCEHLVDAVAPMVKDFLNAAPGLKILASSREPLRIAGESLYTLAPLAVPGPREAVEAQAMAEFESVRLFLDRAALAVPDFTLDADNAPAIAAICHQLDGIPLGIELAAARVRSLSPQQIAFRLRDRFRLLSAGDRTAMPRQRTLRAMIDWSHDLLPDDERELFRRLAVFSGGWTVEAAESVCSLGSDGVDVIDVMSRLVEKSLVLPEKGAQRYGMLETVRHYALDRLEESGELPAMRDAHLAHFARMAEEAHPHLSGSAQAEWLGRLDAERENLLSAHEHAGTSPEASAPGVNLVTCMKLYWANRGLLELGSRLVDDTLRRPAAMGSDETRGRLLFIAGQFRYFMGRYFEARQCLEEALALARKRADAHSVANVLQPLGMAAIGQGDLAKAREWLEEAVEIARGAGDKLSLAGAANSLGMLHRVEGRLEASRALYEEVVQLAREANSREPETIGMLNLAMIAVDQGDRAAARELLVQALQLARSLGSAPSSQSALEVCAGLAATESEWRRAARFYGAAEQFASRTGAQRDAADEAFLAPKVALARYNLQDPAFDRAREEGAALPAEAALDEARSWLARSAEATYA